MPDLKIGPTSESVVGVELSCDGGEAGIVGERVESRIYLDRNQIEDAVLAGFREPLESQVDLAERKLNPGELQRRHVPLGRVRFEFPQDLERLLALPRQRKRPAERTVHARGLRREMDGALKSGERLVEVLPLLLDNPENPVGGRQMPVQLDGVVA